MLDANSAFKPDIVGSVYPLPASIRDASVDEIRAVDVLEHLPYRQTDAALRDWARVLKPGGKIYIQVPDAERVMLWYATTPSKLVDRLPDDLPQTPLMGAAWRLLGGQNDGIYAHTDDTAVLNLHMSLWNEKSMLEALEQAGLQVVDLTINLHPNLMIHAVKRAD